MWAEEVAEEYEDGEQDHDGDDENEEHDGDDKEEGGGHGGDCGQDG